MNIPEYWARGAVDERGREVDDARRAAFVAFGWSHESMAAAQKMAVARAKNVALHFGDRRPQADWPAGIAASGSADPGGGQPPPDAYLYDERPAREQIIERNDADGWVLTRNSYGCVVLNAAHVMFVDIDLEPAMQTSQLSANAGCLGGLLAGMRESQTRGQAGGSSSSPSSPMEQAGGFMQRIADVVDSLDGMGVRVYRTAAGLRAVVTTEPCDPTSDLTQDTMHAFGVDPRYANLCRVQESFRARLTPKPWRCDRRLGSPPARYPFQDQAEVAAYERWLARYNLARVGHGVCEYVQTIGSDAMDEQVRPVLELHDKYTLSHADVLA